MCRIGMNTTRKKECAELLEQLRSKHAEIEEELQKDIYTTFSNIAGRSSLYLTGKQNSRFKQSPKERLLAAISSGSYVNSEEPLANILSDAELSLSNKIPRTLHTLVREYVVILKQLKMCEIDLSNKPNSSYIRNLQKYLIGPEKNLTKLNNSLETIEFLKEELGPSDLDRFLLLGEKIGKDRTKYIIKLVQILIRRYKANHKDEFETNRDVVKDLLRELNDRDLDKLEILSEGTPYKDLFFTVGSTNEINVFKNILKRRIESGNNEGAFTSLSNIIESYIQKRNFEEAERFLKKELMSDPSDIYRQELNNYLVVVLLHQDKYLEAVRLLVMLLEDQLIKNVPDNDYILSLISLLIDISKEVDELSDEEVEVLYKKKLDIQRNVLGMTHPETIKALNDYLKYITDHNDEESARTLIKAELPANSRSQYATIVNYYLTTLESNSKKSSNAFLSSVIGNLEGGSTRKLSVPSRMTTRCTSKQILRAAYTRKSKSGRRTTVKAACIRDVGRPGKGLRSGEPGIGTLKKGLLAKFGYSDIAHKSDAARHAALNKAVKAYGALSVFRKLNAGYVYTKLSSPASSKIFLKDRDWIKRTHM